MTDPFLSRFSDMPALVAPERHERFEACLAALSANPEALALLTARAAAGDDEFWTELGDGATKRFRPYVVKEGILLIPVKGVLLHGFPYQFFDWATGYEYIWKAFERGLEDGNVLGIAFVIDSPGGEVAGNFDLVDKLFGARGAKPVRAFAAESAYSAAYSIASAADQIAVSRTGGVGSIGVFTVHVDLSRALEADGVKVTFIFAGAHKVDGNPYAPLPDAVKAHIQTRVDALYEIFVNTVARNRGLDAAAVRATEALTYTATEAISIDLADSVGSLENALAEFAADLTNPDTEDETMSDQKAAPTVASVKADHPEVANALIAEGKEQGKAEAKAESEKALTAERKRVADLDKLAAQVGDSAAAKKIIADAKADGSSAADTSLKLFEAGAHKASAAAAALDADEDAAKAANPAAAGGKATVPQTDEGWAKEWQGSAELQREFPSEKAYVAFQRDEAKKKGGAK